MLRLINICKNYQYGDDLTEVLKNVNIDFKKQELVFILGSSGSGKSTLLNILGGLIEPTSGTIMIDNQDITKFNNKMMCNYRNNMIGFIHQNYHLVEYMNVFDNIKLARTIKNNDNDIENILRRLGIYSKRKMLVNRLSGGEKQRVAIARALINNPDIILCDEPTGALDSANSHKIMRILKDISKDKLVIVVSHDLELANTYADRVININDGMVPYYEQIDNQQFREIVKKKISLLSIIKLAIRNLSLKKGRTIFTSLAVSIGLICMLLVLCLSNSFSDDINNLEQDIVSNYPINVSNGKYQKNGVDNSHTMKQNKGIGILDINKNIHQNKITNDYLNYLKDIKEISYLSYNYDISMPFITDRYKEIDDTYKLSIPSSEYIDKNYDILYGNNIANEFEILLVLDQNNNVELTLLESFDIKEDIGYEDIIGRKIKVVTNDNTYLKKGDYYYINDNYQDIYQKSNIELTIVGIIKEKETINNKSHLYYSESLINKIIEENKNSQIVLKQLNQDDPLFPIFNKKEELLSYLGYETIPIGINIYTDTTDDREVVLQKLDNYNKQDKTKMLIYTDTMKEAIDLLKDIIKVITIILVIFSLISIFISSLMIFILTNNRVMERIKEIGILRSLGARKKDISRLFNIENLIISILSSIIGIIVVYSLKEPINILMEYLMDTSDMFKISKNLVIICLIFNTLVVVLSGFIPAKIASRKKIIDCLDGRVG